MESMETNRPERNYGLLIFGFLVLVLGWSPSSAHGWNQDWEKTLASAKREGKVIVAGPPGQSYRDALVQFQKAYPNIQVEYFGIQGSQFAPRIIQERRAGQFLWDINIGGGSTMFNVLMPANTLDPFRPALTLPEIFQDKNWRGGFDDGWVDLQKKYIYAFLSYLQYVVYINRDVIPETQFTKAEDLWDPKWKGKIILHDPRREGIGNHQGTVILLNFGEGLLRRLFTEQAPVITKDYRQLVEWVVRGRYPIGVGVNPPHLTEFQKEGVGRNVKPLKDPRLTSAIAGFGNVAIINRAPNPSATKVYVNWLLSKEGQTIFARITGQNSRRLDAEVGDPEGLPLPGISYLNGQKQENQEARKKVNQIAREILNEDSQDRMRR